MDTTVKPANADAIIQQWTDVHGISSAPVEDKVDGYPHKVWRKDGVDVVESYTITGMAHGTPLATGTDNQGYGKAGPFLLEAGISSSYHIAKFFGLTSAERVRADTNELAAVGAKAHSSPLVPNDVEIIPDERVEILSAKTDEPKLEDTARGPIDVMAIITKALTSAGLMKPPA
jgi:feruloyl esterase